MIDNLNNKFSDTSVISLPYLSSPTGVSATNGDDKMKITVNINTNCEFIQNGVYDDSGNFIVDETRPLDLYELDLLMDQVKQSVIELASTKFDYNNALRASNGELVGNVKIQSKKLLGGK
jgi:hypothetical protein